MSLIKLGAIVTLCFQCGVSFANCEAGAYFIHTIAKYKPTEENRTVLLYRKLSNVEITMHGNSIDGNDIILNNISKNITSVKFKDKSCNIKATFKVSSKYKKEVAEDGGSYESPANISIPNCKAILDTIPESGYLIANFKTGEFNFPSKLEVSILPNPKLTPDLLKTIQKEFKARPITISKDVGGTIDGGEIKLTDIKNFESPIIEITNAGKKFQMMIAKFKISNLNNLFTFSGWNTKEVTDKLQGNLKNKTMDFPIIYFKYEDKEPFYIGDGSWCSAVLASRASENAATHLGDPNRYQITNAFDFDGDGRPDILELNGRFAYLIEKDGSLLVVNYGTGC